MDTLRLVGEGVGPASKVRARLSLACVEIDGPTLSRDRSAGATTRTSAPRARARISPARSSWEPGNGPPTSTSRRRGVGGMEAAVWVASSACMGFSFARRPLNASPSAMASQSLASRAPVAIRSCPYRNCGLAAASEEVLLSATRYGGKRTMPFVTSRRPSSRRSAAPRCGAPATVPRSRSREIRAASRRPRAPAPGDRGGPSRTGRAWAAA
jgi:hypothetical protein